MKVRNLFYAGVHDALSQDVRTRVVASNVILVAVSLILLIVLGLSARGYATRGIHSFAAAVPIILFCLSTGCLVLNNFRYYLLSKLIFFVLWTFIMTLFPLWRSVSLYAYFIHPVFGIISSTMVLLMFSYRKERIPYIAFLLFSVLITIFSFDFLSYFDTAGLSALILSHTPALRLHLYPFFFTVFFNLVLIYVLRSNNNFFDKQQQQHDTIVSQNLQLEESRQTLEQVNSQLEQRVHERTLALQEQNTRLTDYAFFHAHVLRAPVSRIRGLLNLLNMPIDADEEKKVHQMLSQAMQELDDTIKQMNDTLHATDILPKTEN